MEKRLLSGVRVGISISQSEDSGASGFAEINRLMLRFVAALLAQGGSLSFGHDWRDDGVMSSLYQYLERYMQPLRQRESPLVYNLIAWPDKPGLDKKERARLVDILLIEQVLLPAALRVERVRSKYERSYLRRLALSILRVRLAEISNCRICVGGRTQGFAGRLPGIIEEAYFCIRKRKPLYVVGMLGGASQQLIAAFDKQAIPSQLEDVPAKWTAKPSQIKALERKLGKGIFNSQVDVWNEITKLGTAGLSELNGLTISENRRLFSTQTVDEALDLVLAGMGRKFGNA